jgi:N-acetylgalactosamine-6-sulfatase
MKLPLALAVLLCGQAIAAERPPNIVFLFADDLGWGDLACYGHPYARSPNLDQLAADGTRFTRAYSTGVTCCPSRTGFMTGKFPATFAAYPANGGFGNSETVSALLKRHGYTTGHFGKWHIGPETKPGTYGFDVIGTGAEEGGKRMAAAEKRCRDAPVYDAAIRFIADHKDKPFYVNVWGHISHHRVEPSPELVAAFPEIKADKGKLPASLKEKYSLCEKLGKDPDVHLRTYLAEIQALDAEVGRLLRKLDELGLRENTIVVFSSDQGPAPFAGKAGKKRKDKEPDSGDSNLNLMGSAGSFTGGKHEQSEGGLRIPFIVRWPGQVPAGRVDETSVISGADWLPTLCSLTGAGFDPKGLDGEDTAAAWRGKPFARSKVLLWKTSSSNSPVSILDGKWKLHLTSKRGGEPTLHDIESDPGERTNIADNHPEIVHRLSAKIMEWQAILPERYDKGGDDE